MTHWLILDSNIQYRDDQEGPPNIKNLLILRQNIIAMFALTSTQCTTDIFPDQIPETLFTGTPMQARVINHTWRSGQANITDI